MSIIGHNFMDAISPMYSSDDIQSLFLALLTVSKSQAGGTPESYVQQRIQFIIHSIK